MSSYFNFIIIIIIIFNSQNLPMPMKDSFRKGSGENKEELKVFSWVTSRFF